MQRRDLLKSLALAPFAGATLANADPATQPAADTATRYTSKWTPRRCGEQEERHG